jgi:hypothetical protein
VRHGYNVSGLASFLIPASLLIWGHLNAGFCKHSVLRPAASDPSHRRAISLEGVALPSSNIWIEEYSSSAGVHVIFDIISLN